MPSESPKNLIGFLVKKSLFKANKKQTEIISNNIIFSATDVLSRSITPKTKHQSKSQFQQFNVFQNASEKQLFKKGVSEKQKSSQKQLNRTDAKFKQEKIFDKINSNDKFQSNIKNQAQRQQNPQRGNFKKLSNSKNKNIFIGFNTSPKIETKTFESLQTESQYCLEQLSFSLHEQISSLNSRIDSFYTNIIRILNSELESVKIKISFLVQEAFKEAQTNVKLYMKQQQNYFIGQALSIKNQLDKQHAKIQQMKAVIKTNEWRKTAAEIIASDLETQIHTLIHQAQNIVLKPLQINEKAKNDQLLQVTKALESVFHFQNWVK